MLHTLIIKKYIVLTESSQWVDGLTGELIYASLQFFWLIRMTPLIKTFAARPAITSLTVKYSSKLLLSFVAFDE
jgi:hypothetical protein